LATLKTYTVQQGETISDVCLNSTGSLKNWGRICDANNFATWTPVLTANQKIVIPDTVQIDSVSFAEMTKYPSNNNPYITDLDTKINDCIVILNAVTDITETEQPKYIQSTTLRTYTVQAGETITDVCINATGTINNWGLICDANGFNTWTPTLTAGQVIIIPDAVEMQTNVLYELNQRPVCNNSVPDSKINDVINEMINPTPPVTSNIFAGTSPDGLILLSTDGSTWDNLGSAGKGNPLAFCQLLRTDVGGHYLGGHILYSTDTGWLVNYTNGYTQLITGSAQVRAICSIDPAFELLTYEGEDIALLGDDNGRFYVLNTDQTIYLLATIGTLGKKINSIYAKDTLLFFKEDGIYDYMNTLLQAGNFNGHYDAGSGIIYAYTTNGHIWKSTDSGATWSDLGNKTRNESRQIYGIVKTNSHYLLLTEY